MLMTEYAAAYQKPSGNWCIEVNEHKTDYKFGPVEIFLTPSDYELLKIYVTLARLSLNPQDKGNVFPSYTGRSLTGGDVSKSLHRAWVKAGIFDAKFLSKNFCKLASTGIRETDPDMVSLR